MKVILISLVVCAFFALWVNALPVKNDTVANTIINAGTNSNSNEITTISPAKVLFTHLRRRAIGGRLRYADRDEYYDDRDDDAGYDRQGSEVGYMSRHDDFPTVVW